MTGFCGKIGHGKSSHDFRRTGQENFCLERMVFVSQTTKRALEASLKKLLLQKPLNKITINDITEDCGVNRMTFYYHFKDIYDLVDWILVEDASKILEGRQSFETWNEAFLDILQRVQENKTLVLNVYRSVGREQVEQYLYKLLDPTLKEYRLSGSRSSLRGRSSSRRRAAAGSHADSQDQSSNGNTNILEFHIKNLLTFEKTVSRKAVQVKPFRKKIF